MTEDYDEPWTEEQTYFVDCTCEHNPEQHGWGECNVPECPCEGGWEE